VVSKPGLEALTVRSMKLWGELSKCKLVHLPQVKATAGESHCARSHFQLFAQNLLPVLGLTFLSHPTCFQLLSTIYSLPTLPFFDLRFPPGLESHHRHRSPSFVAPPHVYHLITRCLVFVHHEDQHSGRRTARPAGSRILRSAHTGQVSSCLCYDVEDHRR
jgi:hypothetical protein